MCLQFPVTRCTHLHTNAPPPPHKNNTPCLNSFLPHCLSHPPSQTTLPHLGLSRLMVSPFVAPWASRQAGQSPRPAPPPTWAAWMTTASTLVGMILCISRLMDAQRSAAQHGVFECRMASCAALRHHMCFSNALIELQLEWCHETEAMCSVHAVYATTHACCNCCVCVAASAVGELIGSGSFGRVYQAK